MAGVGRKRGSYCLSSPLDRIFYIAHCLTTYCPRAANVPPNTNLRALRSADRFDSRSRRPAPPPAAPTGWKRPWRTDTKPLRRSARLGAPEAELASIESSKEAPDARRALPRSR